MSISLRENEEIDELIGLKKDDGLKKCRFRHGKIMKNVTLELDHLIRVLPKNLPDDQGIKS